MVKKILIVDDVVDDLNAMYDVLEKEGYAVQKVSNGADALDKIEDNKYDLIIIDIKMPTLSGYDLSRLMKGKIECKSKMMYITIVPKDDVDLKDVDGFVQKPFSPETLNTEVKRILEE